MGTKNHDFMDGKRDAFEQYLQVGQFQIYKHTQLLIVWTVKA